MARFINTAAAQMGPIARSETRRDAVRRLVELLREAKGRGAELVVFPELCFTTFFPRWLIEDEAELDSFYETEMPGPETAPLFDEAKKLGVGFYVGYAELVREDDGASVASTRRSSSMAMEMSWASTARFIFPATTRTAARPHPPASGEALFRAGQSGLRGVARFGTASWACASATTAAGQKPTGLWACSRLRW
jgi:hypothetical protein